jgi:diguanylate cyclase (GGDEF)-like protein
MNHSIKKIFNYIQLFLIISVFFSTFILLISLNNNKTFTKLNNLNAQKEIVYSLVSIDTTNKKLLDKTALNLMLQDLITKLDTKTEELFQIFEYNFIEKFSADNSLEYTNDLKKLKKLIYNLTDVSIEYYNLNPANKNELKQSASYIYRHINSMIFKDINYNEHINNMYILIIWITFFITLIVSVLLKLKLTLLYRDIEELPDNDDTYVDLHQQDIKIAKNTEIKVTEVIKEKDTKAKDTKIEDVKINTDKEDNNISNDNSLTLDPITGINNDKGLLSCFEDKKDIKDSDCISVTILEIDKFSKLSTKYSKEVTQSILKKITSIILFHVETTDIIAKTDYNQFTIILSRQSESQSIDDINTIHQSISEMKITNDELGDIILTISAGFMVKHKSISIDEVLEKTNQLMLHSRKKGGDMISYIKDLIKDDLYKLARVS